MNTLILGGTKFLGRHIVNELLAGGHRVSILTRGQSPDELPPQVERLRGDRDAGPAGLDALRARSWDACIDVSGYTPRQVRASAEALQPHIGRYVFVSTVSVYEDSATPPVSETFPLLPPAAEDITEINGETYGPLKVTCENIITDLYGDKGTILRPQIVYGPHDHTWRFPYWVRRAVQSQEAGSRQMLAPGTGSDHVQMIDVRDLARFTRTVVERGTGGIFNLSGPRITWRELLNILGATNLVWVPADIIDGAGLTFVEMPLFRPDGGSRSSLMHVSNERARAGGLTLTDPATTAADTRAWLEEVAFPPALSLELETKLIQLARQRTTA